MESLIAYVAQRYGLPRENLATEVLVQVLRSCEDSVVRALFRHYGLELPLSSEYRLLPQRKGNKSRGIPDIQVKDCDENTIAVIENKFGADFTHHQLNSYLKEIDGGGLLLFVVPERRQRRAFDTLMDFCRTTSAESRALVIESEGTRASVNGKNLVVTSWQRALDILKEGLDALPSGSTAQRSCSDIEQLRRFCEVADKETFAPLTADQLSSSETPTLIRHLTWIAQKLIFKCIEAKILEEVKLSKKNPKYEMRAEFDSSTLSFGQSLSISGQEVWIGFWALAWETGIGSPICIELDPERPEVNRILRQLRAERGEDFAIVRHLPDRKSWLIPIPIKPCVPQDEVVEEAFRFVSYLKASIDNATNH